MDFVANYHAFKETLVASAGDSHALMHVHAGLAIYVLFQVIWGTRRGSVPGLVCVALFEIFNEICDRAFYGSWRVGDTLGDIATTMFWPAVLVAVSRFRRWQWNARQANLESLWRQMLVR